MDSEAITGTLRKCELFEELSDDELSSMVQMGDLEDHAAGDILYEQGSVGAKIYVLTEGQVSLYRRLKLEDGRMAETPVYVLRQSHRRRIIGGWCCLIGKEHVQMCTARCDKPSRLVSVNCGDLQEIMAKYPDMRMKILERLVLILRDRLESSYAAMETL